MDSTELSNHNENYSHVENANDDQCCYRVFGNVLSEWVSNSPQESKLWPSITMPSENSGLLLEQMAGKTWIEIVQN
jgi:hypothetical protein